MNRRLWLVLFSITAIILAATFFYLRNSGLSPKKFTYGKSKIDFVSDFQKPAVNKAFPIIKRKSLSKKLPGQFALVAKSKSNLFFLDKNKVKAMDANGNIAILHTVNGEFGGIDIDSQGNFYIAEAKLASSSKVNGEPTPVEPKITVLSGEGKRLRTLKMTDDVYILPKISKNKLFVSDFHVHIPQKRKMDQQTIYKFDLNGKFLSKVSVAGNIKSYGIDSKENLYTGTQLFSDKQYSGLRISKTSAVGKLLNEHTFELEKGSNGFQEVLGFAGTDKQGFIYISYDRWKKPGVVKKFDINGQLKEVFTKPSYDFDWLFVSQEGEVFSLKDTSQKNNPHSQLTLYKMAH